MTEEQNSMDTSSETTDVHPINDVELQNTNLMPAIFTNKFYISVGAGGVRITFSELQKAHHMPIARSAVMMHPEDALALARTIQGLFKEVEELSSLANQTLPKE